MENSTWNLHGRKLLKTDETHVTSDNLLKVLKDNEAYFSSNTYEINYLWNYYKGIQPILNKEKQVRPEINNKIVENHAQEIVNFKTSYLVGEPIQYNLRTSDDVSAKNLDIVNGYMQSIGKSAKDRQLSDWMHICGMGYRIILPDNKAMDGDSPFRIDNLDPRYTGVIYTNDFKKEPVVAFTVTEKTDNTKEYTCYTEKFIYSVKNDVIVLTQINPLGMIPIIEYPLNDARMGEIEVVLPLLDALNSIASNRMDGIEQFVQSFLLFHNTDIDADKLQALKELGAIAIADKDSSMPGSVTYVGQELSQTQTQTFKDDIYATIRLVVGMPSTSDGSTGASDNGIAIIYKNGWSLAEAKAKSTEEMWMLSDRKFLRIVATICDICSNISIKPGNIYPHFTRRNYENTLSKAQIFSTLMACTDSNGVPWISPQLAYETCGLFPDSVSAWRRSEEYRKKEYEKLEADNDGGNVAGDTENAQSGFGSGTENGTGQSISDRNQA